MCVCWNVALHHLYGQLYRRSWFENEDPGVYPCYDWTAVEHIVRSVLLFTSVLLVWFKISVLVSISVAMSAISTILASRSAYIMGLILYQVHRTDTILLIYIWLPNIWIHACYLYSGLYLCFIFCKLLLHFHFIPRWKHVCTRVLLLVPKSLSFQPHVSFLMKLYVLLKRKKLMKKQKHLLSLWYGS